jgi:hypothetical protein
MAITDHAEIDATLQCEAEFHRRPQGEDEGSATIPSSFEDLIRNLFAGGVALSHACHLPSR